MITPKVGLRGQYVLTSGNGAGPRCGSVTHVNTDGTVAAKEDFGTHSSTAMEFVDVGAAPVNPNVDYFQAIDAAS